ncbi:MAG: polysaccharide pyruvyl transferase CsaB [Bacillota bacterium]
MVISGYYGFGNCGDEAMLFAIITLLRRRIPDLRVAVLSQRPRDTAREFGVQAVPRRDVRLIIREMKDADLLLSGGGNLFQDVTSVRSVFYYAAIVLLARMLGIKICVYGQGIGPLNHRASRCLVGWVLRLANVITLRDERSLKELAALGVSRPAHVMADPVFGLGTELGDSERGRALLDAAGVYGVNEGAPPDQREPEGVVGQRPPVIGISLRRWPDLGESLESAAHLADSLAAEGWKVVFVPLQPSDVSVLNTAREKMRHPAIIMDNIKGFRDLMAVMTHLDFCVGMRLHFLIFAALFGVPSVGLSYDPKVTRFMEQVGMPAVAVGEVTAEALMRVAGGLLLNKEPARKMLNERMMKLKARAEENADLVAALLPNLR